MKQLSAFLALTLLFGTATAQAEGWGHLKGKIVVEGDAPKLPPVVKQGENVKDANVCAVKDIPNDSLVLSDKGELANCFVYLYMRRGTPDIHPSLVEPAEERIRLDNNQCRFIPHAGVVRTDQKLNAFNSDACGHNVHTFPLKNNAHNVLIAANDKTGVELEFNQSELLPMQVKCDIHPWMIAYWLVVDHPYAVVSDEEGNFEIQNIPAGKHTFRIWNERTGYIERAIDVEITDGQTKDLGQIKVDAAKLRD